MNKIIINLDKEIAFDIGEYYCSLDHNLEIQHKLTINSEENDKFLEIINDKDRYNKIIEIQIDVENMFDDEFNDKYKDFNVKNSALSYEEFMNSPYKIEISGTKEQVLKYINDNKLVDIDKDVIINTSDIRFNLDSIEEIKDLMNSVKGKNIFIYTDGNLKETSLIDYYKTIELVDNITNEIKSLQLSPLEQLMYLYDIVRDRYYILENEGEDSRLSRDLTSSLLNDTIVCEGYATIFSCIASKLGLKCRKVLLSIPDEESGHARAMAYIDDKKYDFKGFLYFDPTWDCKKKDDDSHFDYYKYFGLSYNHFAYIDGRNGLISNDYPVGPASHKLFKEGKDYTSLSHSERMAINRFYRFKNNKEMEESPLELILEGNQLKGFISNKRCKELTNDSKEIIENLTNDLGNRKFIELLFNVRKLEYYKNPNKYPLSKNKILEITKNSRAPMKVPKKIEIMNSMLNRNISGEEIVADNLRIDTNSQRIKLCKTLRNVLDKKKEDE